MLPCQSLIDRDPLLYIDVTQALRRGIGQVLYADEGGCLIGFLHDDSFTTLFADLDAAKRVFAHLPKTENALVGVHEAHCLPYLRETFSAKPFLGEDFFQAAYLAPGPVPIPACPFPVVPLTPAHLQAVAELYRDEEESYLLDRLEAGVMLGAFDGGTLAGIVGVHREGSIGLLHVRPQYRRQGLGKVLEAHMICRLLSLGQTPYGSVLTGNTASLALQRSLGMTLSASTFHWLSIP